MCTAVLSIEPGLPVLLAGVRDELTDRAWEPPDRHWPQYPGLTGGRDLLAGGTWLAVSDQDRRVGCVLNANGRMAPAATRRSRGGLPLTAAAGEPLDRDALADVDPFHLLTAEPGRAIIQSWDGCELTERTLPPGLHVVVNSGLVSDLAGGGPSAAPAASQRPEPPPDDRAPAARAPNGREHELARIVHFLERFRSAARPDPRPAQPVADGWGSWFPLVNGDGIGPDDLRALIVRRDLGGRRTWGTTSLSLVCLTPDTVRYDFTGRPGDPASWYRVL
ncbi:MAG TPA: NRDE family protein [Streptosporangiaceae bacterium]|nr:NRDE family protein [Streptosporangiaceae bacterium]